MAVAKVGMKKETSAASQMNIAEFRAEHIATHLNRPSKGGEDEGQ